jgi:hypothetical protein
MEKPDPYGEWVLQKVQQETGGNQAPIPDEVLAAARATWPRIVIHATREFERQGSTRDIRCKSYSELERKIAIRQVTDRMDGWTKKVWQARQYGYSWKDISTWLGITEHQAKMKFQYGVERTRANLLRSLEATWVKKSG